MLEVPGDQYDAIVTAAIDAAPAEAVGVLGGKFDEATSRVRVVKGMENVAMDPRTAFDVDPAAQYAVMERLRDEGHDVVGFYHSHPAGPAGPSGVDAERAAWRRRSHVIVSLATTHPVVASWRWDGERFVREAIRVR